MRFFFWLFNPSLYRALQPYRVTDDAQMPLAYQNVPGGRPLSTDWGFLWLPSWLQPWQKVPRMERSYRAPQPFKCTSGKFSQQYVLSDPDYPLAPGAQTMMRDYNTVNGTFRLLHVLADVAEDDGWATFSANLGGVERHAFTQFHKRLWNWIPFIGGRTLKFYWGARPDLNVSAPQAIGGSIRSDMDVWFPEGGVTLVK